MAKLLLVASDTWDGFFFLSGDEGNVLLKNGSLLLLLLLLLVLRCCCGVGEFLLLEWQRPMKMRIVREVVEKRCLVVVVVSFVSD